MNLPLTPQEAIEKVYRTVEKYTAKGMCWKCAIIIAADVLGVDPERVEDVWVERSAKRLPNCL